MKKHWHAIFIITEKTKDIKEFFMTKSLASVWAALFLLAIVPKVSLAQHNCANCPNKLALATADSSAPKTAPVYSELPGQGKKVKIDDVTYFIYKFDKKPKMGTSVLKVQVFDKTGKRDTTLAIIGHSGMPSMKGAHDVTAAFKLNKKGDYLMPVNVVMPGQWEIKLDFNKADKVIYRGSFKFGV